MLPLALLLATLVGLSLGLLGGGGSILTTPILHYVLGVAEKPAIAMSFPVVGLTSLVGALGHRRAGNLNARIALGFGALSFGASYVAGRLSKRVPGELQLLLLAVMMLLAAMLMLRSAGAPSAPGAGETTRPSWALGVVALGVGAELRLGPVPRRALRPRPRLRPPDVAAAVAILGAAAHAAGDDLAVAHLRLERVRHPLPVVR